MFSINAQKKLFSLENNGINLACDYKNGLRTLFFNNSFSSVTSNKNLSFFTLETCGKTYESDDFEVESVVGGSDFSSELITVKLKNIESGTRLRLHFLSDKKETVEIIFQFKSDFKKAPRDVVFHSPFLAALSYENDDKVYFPAAPAKNKNGESAVKFCEESYIASDMKLPLVVTSPKEDYGFSVSFPFVSDLIDCGSAQNRNVYFTTIKDRKKLEANSVNLALNDSFNDSVIFSVTALSGGWVEAFKRLRKTFLSNYDLSAYKEHETESFKKCVVNNFTFLFGDSFNRKDGKIDTAKIIREGKEFGGYDTVTLCNQYPRLGVDSRSQWDFYNDFPGGKKAFKKAIAEFHKENIKVFLPFIPWDKHNDESQISMAEKLCELLRDTDADGLQLDTLDSLPSIFIKKLRLLKKPIILTSQLHPAKGKPIEKITTSWDEFFNPISMPKINLSRFLMPAHIAPAVSRWSRLEGKDELIDYAVFNGEPILVWEDVFGRNLPFSSEQKRKIALYKKIYLENIDIFSSDHQIPLYPTAKADIFCSLFKNNCNTEFIYSLYNASDKAFCGKVLKLYKNMGKLAKSLYFESSAYIEKNFLFAKIPAQKTVLIKISL